MWVCGYEYATMDVCTTCVCDGGDGHVVEGYWGVRPSPNVRHGSRMQTIQTQQPVPCRLTYQICLISQFRYPYAWPSRVSISALGICGFTCKKLLFSMCCLIWVVVGSRML